MPLKCSNPEEIRRLRMALDSASYNAAKLTEYVEWSPSMNGVFGSGPLLLWKLREIPKLRDICALFLLQMPVKAEDAAAALAPAGIDELIEAGLLRKENESVYSNFRIVPSLDALIVFDLKPDGAEPRPDFVMGPSISSWNLISGTIRKPVSRTLDLCAGSGIQSFLASAHSGTVIAAEKNFRAIRLGEFSAILNNKQNVEFRESDFFSAVEGERFDLIVVNPPYIISPGSEFLFRDAGLGADRVGEFIARNAPRFLEENGYCHFTCDWANYKGIPAEEHLSAWAAGSGCDMLVLKGYTTDRAEYPLSWLYNPATIEQVEYQTKYRKWMDYYEQEGIESMTYGVITLRRRSSGPNWFHLTDDVQDFSKLNGGAVERLFLAKDYLTANAADETLLSQSLVLNKNVRFDQRMLPKEEAWYVYECALTKVDGSAPPWPTDPYLGGLCARLRGEKPLRESLAQMAASLRMEPDGLARQVLPMIRNLIELGYIDWQ